MPGVINLDDVFRMLDACAVGNTRKVGLHYWCVRWEGREYPILPTGAKSDKRKEVQLRKVAKMIQVLRINVDCAMNHLPQLATVAKQLRAD